MSSIPIEPCEDEDAIAEFAALHDRVYASRAVRWRSSRSTCRCCSGRRPRPPSASSGRSSRARAARSWRACARRWTCRTCGTGTSASDTLVLDDNWPSRRTGEGLGGALRANYVAYRRNFKA